MGDKERGRGRRWGIRNEEEGGGARKREVGDNMYFKLPLRSILCVIV